MRKATFKWSTFFVLVFIQSQIACADLVLIFSDSHGNLGGFKKVLAHAKSLGVKHVIGLGDYVKQTNATELDEMLKPIEEITGVAKSNTHLLSGNWEAELKLKQSVAVPVISSYGNLVNQTYNGYGEVTIDGVRMFLSHYPQMQLPETLYKKTSALGKFTRIVRGHTIADKWMKKNIHPFNFDLALFGHTHRRGHFVDPVSGVPVINPGLVANEFKSEKEISSYAIFDTETREMTLYAVEDQRKLEAIAIGKRIKPGPCAKLGLLTE